MATLDKGGTVTLQELLVTSLAQTDAGKAPHREGRVHSRRVSGENKGGESNIPGDVPPKGQLGYVTSEPDLTPSIIDIDNSPDPSGNGHFDYVVH